MYRLRGLLEVLHTQLPLLLAAGNLLPRHDLPVRPMRRGGRLGPVVPLRLNLLHHPQHRPQALVLHNRPLIHGSQLVVGGIRQCASADPDLDAPIRILKHLHILAD